MIEFISHNHIRTHMLTYLLRTIDRVFVSFMVCQSIQDESTNYVYLCTTQYPHVRQIQHGERFVNKTGGRLYILAFAWAFKFLKLSSFPSSFLLLHFFPCQTQRLNTTFIFEPQCILIASVPRRCTIPYHYPFYFQMLRAEFYASTRVILGAHDSPDPRACD